MAKQNVDPKVDRIALAMTELEEAVRGPDNSFRQKELEQALVLIEEQKGSGDPLMVIKYTAKRLALCADYVAEQLLWDEVHKVQR